MVSVLCGMIVVLVSAAATVADDETMSQEAVEKAYYESYALEKQQDYRNAMRSIAGVLKNYPSGYTVNFRMGWLSYNNGNYADALQYYRRALTVYPAAIEVLQCVVLVYVAKKDWQKVEDESYKILTIDYYNQPANYWYAHALRMQKKQDVAERVCRKMLIVFPTSVLFLQELGETLYGKGSMEEALTIFFSVKILDPYNNAAKEYIALITKGKKE